MAVYPIDTTNKIGSIRAALDAAGVITAVLYESTSSLIFSTPRSDKIIRINNAGSVIIGDSYTSGATMNNERQVFETYGGTISGGSAVIVSPDIICLAIAYSSTSFSSCVLGALTNGEYFCMGGSTETSTSYTDNTVSALNTTTGESLNPFTFRSANGRTVDDAGFYYTAPIYFKTMTGVLKDYTPVGLSAILKEKPVSAYELFGTSASTYIGHSAGVTYNLDANVIIPGGNA